jgi:hypothetical protein
MGPEPVLKINLNSLHPRMICTQLKLAFWFRKLKMFSAILLFCSYLPLDGVFYESPSLKDDLC